MPVCIRNAESRDAQFLAWVILAAGRSHVERGVWDLLVDGSDDERLRFLEFLTLADTPSFCHHSVFVVAESNDHVGAALCGYDPAQAGTAKLIEAVGEVAERLGWEESEREASSVRVAPFLTCAPEEPKETWIIENVATLPEFRGQGLARALLEEMLDRGRCKGYARAQIAVLIGNTPAQRAYESVGFKVVDEKRHPDFQTALGCPGIARLLRDL